MSTYANIIDLSNKLYSDVDNDNNVYGQENTVDATEYNNQLRKLKDIIKIFSDLFNEYEKSLDEQDIISTFFNPDITTEIENQALLRFEEMRRFRPNNFYKKFLKPIRNIKEVNEATEIFLAALLISYRKNHSFLNIFKSYKTYSNNVNDKLNERKAIFIVEFIEVIKNMIKIESTISREEWKKVPNIRYTDFIIEKERGWLELVGYNEVSSNEDIEKEIKNPNFNYIDYYEQCKTIPSKFAQRFKNLEGKPFWSRIIEGLFMSLLKIFNWHKYNLDKNYSKLKDNLFEIAYIFAKLSNHKKILFLESCLKDINKIYFNIKEIENSLDEEEKIKFDKKDVPRLKSRPYILQRNKEQSEKTIIV